MTIHRRVATATAVAVAGLLSLSGCGSDLSPELHPGAAAVVGETRISLSDVDEKAPELCRFAIETGQIGEELPMMAMRVGYLQALVDAELAEQFLDETGAADDPELRTQLRQGDQEIREEAEMVPASVREIFVEIATLNYYTEVVRTFAGEEFARWAAEQEVILDPRFPAVDPEGARLAGLSVPVSDLARKGEDPQSQQEYDDYLASLPASQKCVPAPDGA